MNKILKAFIFSLAIIFVNISIAQKTFLRNDPYRNYKIAQELLTKKSIVQHNTISRMLLIISVILRMR